MPKTKRGEPHPCCGSRSTRHMSTCTGKVNADVVHLDLRPVPVHGCDPRLLDDEDLAACISEAKRRVDDLRARASRLEMLVQGATATRGEDNAA